MTARLITIAALAAALTGCIDNDASVRLFGLCFPPTPASGGGCAFPAKCDNLLLGPLAVDLAKTGDTFYLPIEVDNQRPSNAARAGGTETATAWIEEYTAHFTVAGAGALDATFASPARHPVPPAGTTVVVVPFIPPVVGATLAGSIGATPARVTIELRAKGKYGDGTSFETGAFAIEASVCNDGAVDSCVPDAICPVDTPTAFACPQKGQTANLACQ